MNHGNDFNYFFRENGLMFYGLINYHWVWNDRLIFTFIYYMKKTYVFFYCLFDGDENIFSRD